MKRLHQKFVNEYVKIYLQGKPNGTKAAINAGYSVKSAAVQACRLLKKANIQAAIDRELAETAAKSQVTSDSIMRALKELAYGRDDSGDYLHSPQMRLRALELIGKVLGMFTNRTVVVPETPALSPDEVTRLRRQAALLDGTSPCLPTIDVYDDATPLLPDLLKS